MGNALKGMIAGFVATLILSGLMLLNSTMDLMPVSRKNRPHIDRNLFAIHPVTNSEDFNFQARQMRGHPLFRELC